MNIKENVPLAPFTTFKIGGLARYFVEATTIDEIKEAVSFVRGKNLPLFILGGGSNILVSDDGFKGLVLKIGLRGISHQMEGDEVFVTAGAGEVWDDLSSYTTQSGFGGLECLSGVPGTVGGAVVANVGCYGAQCSDTLVCIEVVDLIDNGASFRILKKEDCNFSYHESIFGQQPGRYLVLRATFSPSVSGSPKLSYRDSRFDLVELASKEGNEPTLADVRKTILDMREQKGHLVMDGRFSYKSAGCFFHMPFVSKDKYSYVVERAQLLDSVKEKQLRPWAWEQTNGSYKLAPGFLLEYTEFQKGYKRGNVGISPHHTLVVINIGDGSASEIDCLARDMQSEVRRIFDVELMPETEYVGEF